jgi:hypothetical protein
VTAKHEFSTEPGVQNQGVLAAVRVPPRRRLPSRTRWTIGLGNSHNSRFNISEQEKTA